tara:strand:- start:1836 stop:2336 length:501 start_codon:yes stop_codon:yes gene_type:complete
MAKYIEYIGTRNQKYTGKNGASFTRVGEIQLIDDEKIYNYLLTEQPSMFREVSDPGEVQKEDIIPKQPSPVVEAVIAPPMLEDDLDMIKAEVLDSDSPVSIETTEDPGSAIETEFSNVLASHEEAMSLKEIAEVMGVSPQKIIAVSKRLIEQDKIKKVGNEYQLII